MISTPDPLKVLVNESGCGEVPSTAEHDKPQQDSKVVKEEGHEPDPRLGKPFSQQAIAFIKSR
jgi:hypothetical protein